MIHILLFASLQEKVGKDRVDIELDQISVTDLKNSLKERYPLTEIDQVMVAINEEYAIDTDIVRAGDTVAFIPPVSGG
ncbi:molybdopterin converting factor subunit 1 [Oceanobacillus senegalensis]|uniref:molybdopterin converting factor subunit 1 n=1 Tax=Oceanobacillus senegalensis TaxID=1936063 RepID=UPI000A312DD7|nr:molybdopterin converting factor subunit 1 [Oceanobacillus senegalensis]